MQQTLQKEAAPDGTVPARSTDRRSVRTRSQLRDALAAEIMATGDLSQVTVTAVTERAGVTRRTFYSHYRDIPDLVGQIEDESIADLRELVARIAATRLDELEETISRFEPCPGSEDLLAYFAERKSYLSALLGDGGDPAFVEKLRAMVHDTVAERALEGIAAPAVGHFFEFYLTYTISALVGVLVRWLVDGAREDVATMARIMTMLAFVRPGDLYGRPIDFDLTTLGLALMAHATRLGQGEEQLTEGTDTDD